MKHFFERIGYMKPFVLNEIIAPSIKVSNEFGNGFCGTLSQTTSGQKYVVTIFAKHKRIQPYLIFFYLNSLS